MYENIINLEAPGEIMLFFFVYVMLSLFRLEHGRPIHLLHHCAWRSEINTVEC
jgi:hypothetical protein